jgi:hypothetical protein
MLPIKIDILRGIVGFRVLVIRAADQGRIARMDAKALREQLTYGLNSQWADLPVMQANGFTVETSSSHENLFGMLAASRFDAFPRGLNEADRELSERKQSYPQLAVEQSKALFFPFPVYFWVRKDNAALAPTHRTRPPKPRWRTARFANCSRPTMPPRSRSWPRTNAR